MKKLKTIYPTSKKDGTSLSEQFSKIKKDPNQRIELQLNENFFLHGYYLVEGEYILSIYDKHKYENEKDYDLKIKVSCVESFIETNKSKLLEKMTKISKNYGFSGTEINNNNINLEDNWNEFENDVFSDKGNNVQRENDIFFNYGISTEMFDKDQLSVIRRGIELDLPKNKISLFSNHLMNAMQMEQIFIGFDNGLSFEKIKFYANINYSSKLMTIIRYGFFNELSLDKMKLIVSQIKNLNLEEDFLKRVEKAILIKNLSFGFIN